MLNVGIECSKKCWHWMLKSIVTEGNPEFYRIIQYQCSSLSIAFISFDSLLSSFAISREDNPQMLSNTSSHIIESFSLNTVK